MSVSSCRKRAEIPVYSFEKHARLDRTTSIYSPHVLILEGIFALYDPRVLELLDMKVNLARPGPARPARKCDFPRLTWRRKDLLRGRCRYVPLEKEYVCHVMLSAAALLLMLTCCKYCATNGTVGATSTASSSSGLPL